jgi:hypothetical protein
MNPSPGAAEEGVKVAGSIVDALKTNPALLALIVLSFGMLGFTFYEAQLFSAQRGDLLKVMIEQQRETSVLLAQCWPGQKQ